MGSFEIVSKPSVQKDLRPLPQSVVARILARIEALGQDPLPSQSVKLAGAENLRRIRVGDYRVVYGVHIQARQVTIQYIRHRREVYR